MLDWTSAAITDARDGPKLVSGDATGRLHDLESFTGEVAPEWTR